MEDLDKGAVNDEVGTFLDLGEDLDDIKDLSTVPEEDYELRLITFERRQKTKGPYLFVEAEIIGQPDTKIVRHVMMLPAANDDERKKQNRKRSLKYFYKAFGIPTAGPIVFADYVGATGWATLTEETDPTYGPQNRIGRFRVAE